MNLDRGTDHRMRELFVEDRSTTDQLFEPRLERVDSGTVIVGIVGIAAITEIVGRVRIAVRLVHHHRSPSSS